MNQHAVPQNVTSYQFRLIGDMTIQQFIYLSVGIGVAIFFYYTNLFTPIKWMLILGSAMLGFAVAFLPLEERPLDQWITNYIKAIYKPTLFTWKRTHQLPEYFSYTPTSTLLPSDIQEISRVASLRRQQGLRSYLVTLPNEQSSSLDSLEKSAVSGVLDMFSIAAPQSYAPTTYPSPLPVSTAPIIVEEMIPVEAPVVPETTIVPEMTEPETPPPPNDNLHSATLTTEDINSPSVAATSSNSLPFPSAPTTTNTLVGMVLDSQEKIVDNAIVEVIDEAGLPVRATKTNQLGQFFSTTPLRRGDYRITIEKSGLTFDTIEISLTGQIVPPLKIQAKS